MKKPIRIAARALILHENLLLLVNAYPAGKSDLWCAPGGGAEAGASLPANLMREVLEETGLTISVGPPALINEFHDPATGFHQVDIFFRAHIIAGAIDPAWRDPEGVVSVRRFFTRAALEAGIVRFKPSSLVSATWGSGIGYDPLEVIAR
jgi:8-oxo-dGTP pyrophosphatase MutT (NUDIX family)